MRFMGGWSCEDYERAPAKFVQNIRLYMRALDAARAKPGVPGASMGPPEAFKRIMRGW
jgi:hypothetical protein